MTLAKECGGCTLQWDTNHKCVFQHQKQRKRKLKLKRSFAMKTFLIIILGIIFEVISSISDICLFNKFISFAINTQKYLLDIVKIDLNDILITSDYASYISEILFVVISILFIKYIILQIGGEYTKIYNRKKGLL